MYSIIRYEGETKRAMKHSAQCMELSDYVHCFDYLIALWVFDSPIIVSGGKHGCIDRYKCSVGVGYPLKGGDNCLPESVF